MGYVDMVCFVQRTGDRRRCLDCIDLHGKRGTKVSITVPFKRISLHPHLGPYHWKESDAASNEIWTEDAV